jgi:P4 family phage/plasmid primase-like protien
MTKAEDSDAEKAARGVFDRRTAELKRLRMAGTIETVMKLMRSDMSVRLESFDGPQTGGWFNCANGMVDLRTGELHPHDPGLRFTKVSPVAYVPGATHADWDQALTAVPPETAAWLQLRLGQAMTGSPPPDDVVPFLFGGGENGKTTMLDGVSAAFGEFAIVVPDKVLLNASAYEHDTLWMSFKGARLAVLEELPDDRWLDSMKLKKVSGTGGMTGRFMREDYVRWAPTHALVVSTNHETQVPELDWGTWRRLARVTFPYMFVPDPGGDGERQGDPGLRERIRAGADGQHEAVLAWLVTGAIRSQETVMSRADMPQRVVEDTKAWQSHGNAVVRFADQFLIYDPGSAVLSAQVYGAYKTWAASSGQRLLSDQVFWTRAQQLALFKEVGVEKKVARPSGLTVDAPGTVLDASRNHRLLTGVRFTEEGRSVALGYSEIGP